MNIDLKNSAVLLSLCLMSSAFVVSGDRGPVSLPIQKPLAFQPKSLPQGTTRSQTIVWQYYRNPKNIPTPLNSDQNRSASHILDQVRASKPLPQAITNQQTATAVSVSMPQASTKPLTCPNSSEEYALRVMTLADPNLNGNFTRALFSAASKVRIPSLGRFSSSGRAAWEEIPVRSLLDANPLVLCTARLSVLTVSEYLKELNQEDALLPESKSQQYLSARNAMSKLLKQRDSLRKYYLYGYAHYLFKKFPDANDSLKNQAFSYACDNNYGACDHTAAKMVPIKMKNAKLPGLVINGYTNLDYIQLPGANLMNADFSQRDGSVTYLTYANLERANLTNAKLPKVKLKSTNLTDANLTDADLEYADLTDANLTNANLTGAIVTHEQLSKAKGVTEAQRNSIYQDDAKGFDRIIIKKVKPIS